MWPHQAFAWYYTIPTCSITQTIPQVSVCCIGYFCHINTAGALAKSHQLKAEPFPVPASVPASGEWPFCVSVFLLCCNLLVDSHWVNTHTHAHMERANGCSFEMSFTFTDADYINSYIILPLNHMWDRHIPAACKCYVPITLAMGQISRYTCHCFHYHRRSDKGINGRGRMREARKNRLVWRFLLEQLSAIVLRVFRAGQIK